MKESKRSKKAFIIAFSLLVAVLIIFIVFRALMVSTLPKLYLTNKYDDMNYEQIEPVSYNPNKIDKNLFFLEEVYIRIYPQQWRFKYNDKEFNVEFGKMHFADDYQLEDISRLCTEYFKKLTGNENIQNVLFTDFNMPTENYYHYRTLRDLLKIDNRLWTENNITEFIEEYSQVWYSDIGIYVSDCFNDIPSLSAEAERLENIINNQFKDSFEQANSEVVHIYFTNQELNVERVSVIHEGVSSRFDYYGFLEKPKYCGSSKLQTDESIVFDEIIVCY